MSVETIVEYDDCGANINDYVYCASCIDARDSDIQAAREDVAALEEEIIELENKLSRLE